MTLEFKKRIFTSICLILLLFLMFTHTYILIISVIIISIISWIEFYSLISKIYYRNNSKNKILRFIYKSLSLLYLVFLAYLILFAVFNGNSLKIFLLYSLLVSIMSDLGGIFFGKLFNGPKLTKISPNKTISGSIGSFIFSILLVPVFNERIVEFNFFLLFFITLLISLTSQFGDLLISFFKRKAKTKNTSDLLPGHGGFLDRIDGIIFAIPIGIFLLDYFK